MTAAASALRRRWLRVAFLAAVAAAVAAIGLAVGARASWNDRPLQFTEVSDKTGNMRIGRRAIITFRDTDGITRYTSRRYSSRKPLLPEVDFDSEMLTVVAMGPRSTTGSRLEPVAVVETHNRVQVQVREVAPTTQSRVRPRLNYPQAALVLPKVDKSVQLKVLEPSERPSVGGPVGWPVHMV